MGPHTLVRGNTFWMWTSRKNCRLQWGRTLSCAEISWSSGRKPGKGALQWGRTLSCAENSSFVLARACNRPAAMGPHTLVRGNKLYTPEELAAIMLQWGRTLSCAEMG